MTKPRSALTSLLHMRGFEAVESAVMQPLDPFLQLSGEDVRRRMFVTADPTGREFCLRPDFTIPVALHHGETGAASGKYYYYGSIFRFRPSGADQFEHLQGGAEWFGETDTGKADVEVIGLALESLLVFGVREWIFRMGDIAVWAAVLDSLDLSPAWRRRVWRELGRSGGMEALLSEEEGETSSPAGDVAPALAKLLGRADPVAAASAIEEILNLAGIERTGARSAGDIAERFLEKAEQEGPTVLPDDARIALARIQGISDAPRAVVDALDAVVRDLGIGTGCADILESLSRRSDAMAEIGFDLDAFTFDMGFVRPFDYYTGMVFDVHAKDGTDAGKLVGGGRYDKLLSFLGAGGPEENVPAIGYSIWIDRLEAAARKSA